MFQLAGDVTMIHTPCASSPWDSLWESYPEYWDSGFRHTSLTAKRIVDLIDRLFRGGEGAKNYLRGRI